jgi:hypothetical protein
MFILLQKTERRSARHILVGRFTWLNSLMVTAVNELTAVNILNYSCVEKQILPIMKNV